MAQRGRRFTLPIWAHLAGFALAVMLPLWALVLYIGLSSLERERAEYQNQTMLVARSFAVDLDHELSGFKSILSVLATSPALADGNLRRFSEQALRVAPEGGAIVLRDRSGAQIVNTLFPFGTKLPERTSETVTATDRCVFETRAVCTSDLYTGVSDKQPYVLVDAPVMRDGEIAYFLNVGVPATNLAALLRAHQTPPGWAISIIDRQDRLIARSPDHDRYVGSLANQSLRESAKDAEGTVRAVNVAGIPVWGAYVRLPTWGWRVAIGVPEAVLNTPLRRSMAYLGGLVLGATALSLAAVIIYGRRLAGAIALLSRLATRIVEPVLLGPIETSVREVNEVSCSIAEASRRLAASIAERDRADAAMRRWNEELEARVAAEIAAREDAQARVLQAQRIQALGQLAGGIAHDFNNVLQAANGCAAAIIKRAGDPDAVRRFAELLLGAVDRGSSVTRRLLGFAKQNDLRAEAIDLAPVLEGLREILWHTLGAHITIDLELPARLPFVFADKGQLETVLVNFATNARDAIVSAGTLTFSVNVETIGAEASGPKPLEAGAYVRIAITDTGSGMDAATLARASEPFFTTKGPGVGTGLGLAMARGFAEQSGGKLEIQSEVGKGTTVLLWLPARLSDAAAEPAEAPARSRTGSARSIVLLVEDEEIVRTALATELTDEGYDVLPVASAEAALAMLDGNRSIGALVTDLNMPGMSGIDLIRMCRAQGLSLPAILLTGNAEYATPLAPLDGALANRFSVLRKPVSGTHLADSLAALMETV